MKSFLKKYGWLLPYIYLAVIMGYTIYRLTTDSVYRAAAMVRVHDPVAWLSSIGIVICFLVAVHLISKLSIFKKKE